LAITSAIPVWDAGPITSAKPVWNAGPITSAIPVWFAGCFPKSELIQTDSNIFISIGSLKVGNKIISWDAEQQKVQYTAVTGIHKYTVTEIMCFNNDMWVSSSHPLMVMESTKKGILMPKWKVAFDVNVGDCLIGLSGKLINIKSKRHYRYASRTEVLNLSTDSGVPFIVGNYVVRAENAIDNIEWADTPMTTKLIVA
jgi:hypothetical protein